MKVYQSALRHFSSLLLLAVSTVHAADFQVNTLTDAVDAHPGDGVCSTNKNVCSLRAAIMETNALAGPDTISLPDGDYRLLITGTNEDLSAKGDLDITDDLTINGDASDPSKVIIDAGGYYGIYDRVLHILSNNKVITVNINDLTITGGRHRDSRNGGGGICIKCEASNAEPYQPSGLGTTDVVVDTTFTPTFTTTSPDTTRPVVNLNDVVVTNNFDLVSGSGIMNSGVLTITDSTISNNSSTFQLNMATGQNGQFMNNSQFIGGGVGGGIANWGGKLTIERSIISNNISQDGGGIYSQNILATRDEKVLIENSQITGNIAFMGGGIFNTSGEWYFQSRALVDYGFVINGTTIDHNQAQYAGGGIYNLGIAAMQLNNATVSNNAASYVGVAKVYNKGGGIYHSGKILDLVNTTVAQNTERRPATGVLDIADNEAGGNDIFIDANEANVVPGPNLPWRVSFLNSIIGDSTSSASCLGTTGYIDYVTNSGGNVDNSGTCMPTTVSNTTTAVLNKISPRSTSTNPVELGELTNNGGISGKELPDGTFPPTLAVLANNTNVQATNCPATDQRGFGRDESTCAPGAFQGNGQTKGIASSGSDLPVARDDRIEAVKNVPIAIPVSELLKNDNDPLQRGIVSIDSNSLTPLDSNAQSPVVTTGTQANNTGLVSFVKLSVPTDFIGQTQFTYTVSVKDSSGNTIISNPATVTVDVNEVQAPVAYTQNITVSPGTTYTNNPTTDPYGNYALKASDLAGEMLNYQINDKAAKGQATVNPDGSYSYVANADATGMDSFTYTVTNTSGLTSKPATVSVAIKLGNISQLNDVSANVDAGKLVLLDLSNGVTGNFFFSLDKSNNFQLGKVLSLDERSGRLLYQANANASGEEDFTYTVVDYNANTIAGDKATTDLTAKISIQTGNTANQGPTADPVSESLDLNITDTLSDYLINQSNASDGNSDTLVYAIASNPTDGEITSFDPIYGQFTYKNTNHAATSDSFQYTVSDGVSTSPPVTVSIAITPQTNVVPVANDDTAMTASDTSIGVNVAKNDTDANGDKLAVSVDNNLSTNGGKVSVNKQNILLYTPPSGFTGQDTVSYKVSDGRGGNATAMLKVNVIQASAGSTSTPSTTDSGNTTGTSGTSSNSGTDQSTSTSTNDSSASSNTGKSSSGALSIWVLLGTLLLRFSSLTFYRQRQPCEK